MTTRERNSTAAIVLGVAFFGSPAAANPPADGSPDKIVSGNGAPGENAIVSHAVEALEKLNNPEKLNNTVDPILVAQRIALGGLAKSLYSSTGGLPLVAPGISDQAMLNALNEYASGSHDAIPIINTIQRVSESRGAAHNPGAVKALQEDLGQLTLLGLNVTSKDSSIERISLVTKLVQEYFLKFPAGAALTPKEWSNSYQGIKDFAESKHDANPDPVKFREDRASVISWMIELSGGDWIVAGADAPVQKALSAETYDQLVEEASKFLAIFNFKPNEQLKTDLSQINGPVDFSWASR